MFIKCMPNYILFHNDQFKVVDNIVLIVVHVSESVKFNFPYFEREFGRGELPGSKKSEKNDENR